MRRKYSILEGIKKLNEYPNYPAMGASAKANAVSGSPTTASSPSPSQASSQSPSTAPIKAQPKKPVVAKAQELQKDFEFPSKEGNVVKVISPFGAGKNKSSVVVQDQKTKEYYAIDPDEKIALPQVDQSEIQTEDSGAEALRNITTRKHRVNLGKRGHRKMEVGKRLKKISKLIRKSRLIEEPIFEINFNDKRVTQSALAAPISCGFEAETVWTTIDGGPSEEYLDNLSWDDSEIQQHIGSYEERKVREEYDSYMWDSDEINDLIIKHTDEWVNENNESEEFLEKFIDAKVDEDDIEEYRKTTLANADEEDLEILNDYSQTAWGREYVDENMTDEYREWLEEYARDNGIGLDEAVEEYYQEFSIDKWAQIVYGSVQEMIGAILDVYVDTGPGSSQEDVAHELSAWTENHSAFAKVEAGEYHQGHGDTTQDYWRVEDDPSISPDGEGLGSEIISPVYETPEMMLSEMQPLFKEMSANDVETNSSTGLHVTMSWSGKQSKTNKLKMALLLGDSYVLKQFDRENSHYTMSQKKIIDDSIVNLKQNLNDQRSLDKLEEILNEFISNDKYRTIHFKSEENDSGNSLIEFRAAGGDYLDQHELIAKTVSRYAAIMQAGHDENAFRKDYIRALVKAVNGQTSIPDEYATEFAGGKLPDNALVQGMRATLSKARYTDGLEKLAQAYQHLQMARTLKTGRAQPDMFETLSRVYEDWTDDLKAQVDADPRSTTDGDWQTAAATAQQEFADAVVMLAIDTLSGKARSKPTAALISGLRNALKEFSLNGDTLWSLITKSEILHSEEQVPVDKLQKAVSQLFHKDVGTVPKAAFTITLNPTTETLMVRQDVHNEHISFFGDIFGDETEKGIADMNKVPTQLKKEHFKVVNREEYEQARNTRGSIEARKESIENLTSHLNNVESDEQSDDNNKVIAKWTNDIQEMQAEIDKWKPILDKFYKKYGFIPKSVRYGSQNIGPEYTIIRPDTFPELSQKFGIKIVATESVFKKINKLPLAEQIKLLSKIDDKSISKVWTKSKVKETPINESAVPDRGIKRDLENLMSKPLLANDLRGQMSAYFVIPDPNMISDFREARATGGDKFDLRPILQGYMQRDLHPSKKKELGLKESVITESRGVTARMPGEEYISVTNPNDILVMQEVIIVSPPEADSYESLDELEAALEQVIPGAAKRVNDNNPNQGTKAALVAIMADNVGAPQYWVRYVRAIPAAGVTGMWKTLRGYKFRKGAETESVPIKPADLVNDESFKTTEQLSTEILTNIASITANSEHEDLQAIMEQAVSYARTGSVAPIAGGAKYFNVLQKYGGEYLGPLAIIDGGNVKGNTPEMLAAYELTTLKGSQIMFPESTAYPLVDSVIKAPNGQDIGVSSKAHTAGGAASSLKGVYDQLTDEMKQQYPLGSQILELIATESAVNGPIKVGILLGLLSTRDAKSLQELDRSSKNIDDLTSARLRKMTHAQGIDKSTVHRAEYRVFYHVLAAIVNTIIPVVNSTQEFKDVMIAALNNNKYVMVLTQGKVIGDDVTLDYYTKFPAVFEGSPQIVNKTYFATGQKGRLGFKLKK